MSQYQIITWYDEAGKTQYRVVQVLAIGIYSTLAEAESAVADLERSVKG